MRLPWRKERIPHNPRGREVKVALIQQVCTAYRAHFFERLSTRLAERQIRLTVFFGKPQRGLTYSGIIPDPKSSGFRFNYKVLPKIAYEGKLPTSPFHFKRSLIFFPTLIFEIGKGKYNLTISDTTGELLNTFPLLIVNKFLLRRKFIIWCGNNMRDNALRASDSIIKKTAYVLARLIYRHCDASVVAGPGPRRFDIYMGTHPNKIFVALNTVDISYFDQMIRARKKEIGRIQKKIGVQGKKSIIYVGVLERRKKLENLILAFQKLSNSMNEVALLLVGDGPHRKFLEDLCIREKINGVHFLGKIDYEEIPLYYALSDVFVLPGQGGIAVAEAMASGTPVIISKECNALRSIPNLVENGENGFIVDEPNAGALAQCIRKVLSDSVLAKKMGAKSKERAERYFSTEGMLSGFEQAIDYAVAHSK
jgi:glycosyltransferase involved in cell wall biosynthesis